MSITHYAKSSNWVKTHPRTIFASTRLAMSVVFIFAIGELFQTAATRATSASSALAVLAVKAEKAGDCTFKSVDGQAIPVTTRDLIGLYKRTARVTLKLDNTAITYDAKQQPMSVTYAFSGEHIAPAYTSGVCARPFSKEITFLGLSPNG